MPVLEGKFLNNFLAKISKLFQVECSVTSAGIASANHWEEDRGPHIRGAPI